MNCKDDAIHECQDESGCGGPAKSPSGPFPKAPEMKKLF
jgi:hypothetical protein